MNLPELDTETWPFLFYSYVLRYFIKFDKCLTRTFIRMGSTPVLCLGVGVSNSNMYMEKFWKFRYNNFIVRRETGAQRKLSWQAWNNMTVDCKSVMQLFLFNTCFGLHGHHQDNNFEIIWGNLSAKSVSILKWGLILYNKNLFFYK